MISATDKHTQNLFISRDKHHLEYIFVIDKKLKTLTFIDNVDTQLRGLIRNVPN